VTVLLIGIGGAVGALCRYVLDHATHIATSGSEFPYGTLLVNAIGSFVLGWVAVRYRTNTTTFVLVGTGFCGAFTTFSTFSYETVRLAQARNYSFAFCNVAVMIAVCCGAAAMAQI
jgi:fluoride exporter